MMPSSDAMTPTTNASRSTDSRIWRRPAPSARSRPFSRVRWATVIENVLKIMKAPTSRATRANTSMKVRKNAIPSRAMSCVSFVTTAPVTASVPFGMTFATAAVTCCWLVPGAATMEMVSNLPGSATSFWATVAGNSVTVAPPGLSTVPNFAMPLTRTVRGGPWTRTVVVSPTPSLPTSALWASMTTSSSAAGARPATSWNGLSSGVSGHCMPMAGAPVAGFPSALPSLPTRRA